MFLKCLESLCHLQKWFSNSSKHLNHLEGSFKRRFLGSTHSISDSVRLGLGPRISSFNKFLADANAACLGNYHLQTLAKGIQMCT